MQFVKHVPTVELVPVDQSGRWRWSAAASAWLMQLEFENQGEVAEPEGYMKQNTLWLKECFS